MRTLQAYIDGTQENVTGTARVKLYKGNVVIVGRKSPFSLYHEDFATFEKEDVYNQMDATGFIRLNALRLRIQALKKDRRSVPDAEEKRSAERRQLDRRNQTKRRKRKQ
jgi:argininosuccinate synthase